MTLLAKSRIASLLIGAAASSALFAQNIATQKHPDHAAALDARQIVVQSVGATERSWKMRGRYTYMERDDDRRLDSLGRVKTENIDVTKMILVNGARFEQLTEHNGQPPSPTQQRKSADDLERLKHETAAEQSARLAAAAESRSILNDLLEAFDFRLIGEEVVGGRPAYVLQAVPHPGYRPHGKYGKIFNKVEGKLWIDKQDFGLIKAEGNITQPVSMGLFVARIEAGSQVILEQTSLGDAVWVPERVEMRANARILFVKSLGMDKILTYSDYRLAPLGAYSVSR
jgi:hypothetical protein